MPPPWRLDELPLTVQLVSVVVPLRLYRPPPLLLAAVVAELPLTVQSVSVSVPPLLNRPPPLPAVVPPVIVIPEIDAVTPPSTRNTRLSLAPPTVTPAAGPVIEVAPLVSVSSSWVPPRVIVWGELNTVLSKVIVSAPWFEFAISIA